MHTQSPSASPDFEKTLAAVNNCYSDEFQLYLPKPVDFENGEIIDKDNKFYRSVYLRIKAINQIQLARDSFKEIDLKSVWQKISESIKLIPSKAIVSSIGSQGFLSIPLFKYDLDMTKFEFIRLHIWDKSIDEVVNRYAATNFSIHNHMFQANSWILCGKILNDRFKVYPSDNESPYSYFAIDYNKTLNQINQHTSTAYRTNTFALVKQISHEEYFQKGTYNIRAGDFHKSGANDAGVSATLFSFTADNNFQGKPSSVIGPSSVQSSEINRKMFFDPTELILEIDKKI